MKNNKVLYCLCIVLLPIYFIFIIPNITAYFNKIADFGFIDLKFFTVYYWHIILVCELIGAALLFYFISFWSFQKGEKIINISFISMIVILIIQCISETYYRLLPLPSYLNRDLNSLFLFTILYIFLFYVSYRFRKKEK